MLPSKGQRRAEQEVNCHHFSSHSLLQSLVRNGFAEVLPYGAISFVPVFMDVT